MKTKQLQQPNKTATRAAIAEMVAAYLDEIDEGNLNPVEAFVYSHKLLEFATLLNSNLKQQIKGVKGDFYGLRISEVKTGSIFDYSACNSPRLQFLVEQANKLKESIEREQAFLKALPGPMEVIDNDTGEIYQVRPPVNYYSISSKIEWL